MNKIDKEMNDFHDRLLAAELRGEAKDDDFKGQGPELGRFLPEDEPWSKERLEALHAPSSLWWQMFWKRLPRCIRGCIRACREARAVVWMYMEHRAQRRREWADHDMVDLETEILKGVKKRRL